MKLFDHIDNISLHKRSLNEDELKSYSPYMINRFVSMSEMFLPMVNVLNQFDIPKDVHNRFMQGFIPKRKQYFKYISSKKDNKSHEIECLQKYFEVGLSEAEGYLDILTAVQLKDIVDKFKSLKGR